MVLIWFVATHTSLGEISVKVEESHDPFWKQANYVLAAVHHGQRLSPSPQLVVPCCEIVSSCGYQTRQFLYSRQDVPPLHLCSFHAEQQSGVRGRSHQTRLVKVRSLQKLAGQNSPVPLWSVPACATRQ